MEEDVRKNFKHSLLFFGGVALLFVGSILIYWYVSIPAGNMVVNEIGEPLELGETWAQNDLFALTLSSVTEIGWNDAGMAEEYQTYRENHYKVYDVCFAISNLSYQGYRDIYRSNAPFTKGLNFWVDVFGAGRHKTEKVDFEIIKPDPYRQYPNFPLSVNVTSQENHCLIVVEPGVEKITVQFTTNREAQDESIKMERTPRPIYRKTYEVYL